MTVNEYLTNPYGKGVSIGSVGNQRADLDKQYLELQSKITCRTYLYRNSAIYHVIVPSRDGQNSYDVVIEIPIMDNQTETVNLVDNPFKAFSNCPSFIFTYAHLFRSRKMLCDWLVDKYDPAVRRKLPTHSNPYGIIGFERSLYLALKFLKSTSRTVVSSVKNSPIKPNSYKEIASMVRTQEQILANSRSRLKREEPAKTLSPTKTSSNKVNQKSNKPGNATGETKTTQRSKTTKTSSRVKSTKKTKKI